jgi:hypothetical protein
MEQILIEKYGIQWSAPVQEWMTSQIVLCINVEILVWRSLYKRPSGLVGLILYPLWLFGTPTAGWRMRSGVRSKELHVRAVGRVPMLVKWRRVIFVPAVAI